MIRIVLTDPAGTRQMLSFEGDNVTIGRAPENDICLNHSKVSKYHGRLTVKRGAHLYIDLSSTNGTIVQHDGKAIPLAGRRISRQEVSAGDIIQISPFQLKIDSEESVIGDGVPMTVLRSLSDLERDKIQSSVLGPGARDRSEPFLHFVRDTAEVMRDDTALLRAISRHAFALFPQASHLVMVLSDHGEMIPVIAAGRDGRDASCTISRTIVQQVLQDGMSLHFVNAPVELDAAESIVQGGISTAICAALRTTQRTIGVIQLDVRGASREAFDRDDLSLLAIFAHHVSLVLDNMRLYQEQRDAFHSTIAALASLRDQHASGGTPGRAVDHVQRVHDCAQVLAQQLDLPRDQQEVIAISALLRECEPAVLRHIHFPADLVEVPRIVEACFERVDGSGPRGLESEQIPLESRVVAAADAVVTVATGRLGNASRSAEELLHFLEGGRGRQWDGKVLDACHEVIHELLREAMPSPATTPTSPASPAPANHRGAHIPGDVVIEDTRLNQTVRDENERAA